MEELEAIKDFLIESNENLARMDQELVEIEGRPGDQNLIASIFRTIHTIKGTCGFLGFGTLEAITHIAESILSQVRDGERELTPALVSLILESVDAVKEVLEVIERTGVEGDNEYLDVRDKLRQFCEQSEGVPSVVTETTTETVSPVPEPIVPPNTNTVARTDKPIDEAARPAVADSTIRVDVVLLDKLMNLVGELVLARNQVLQFTTQQDDAAFSATSQRLNLITSELQENVMKTRMQPIGVVWNKLPRIVRDLAASCRKQIQISMDGADTELDKTIIEAIKDPLTHIVRNSCDHGIEAPAARMRAGKSPAATLSLRAYHEGGHVNIEIADDGAGIDVEKVKARAVQRGLIRSEQAERMSEREAVRLVFLPGFSTADQVTSLSGRGVGMDVVKTNIEKIGGVVDLASRKGEGTTVKIKIPLTLAIIPGLVVTSGQERFVIPQVSLVELVRLEGEAARKQIERVQGAPVFRRRGNLLPLALLNEVLKVEASAGDADAVNIVILQAEDRQFGLVVDGISDTQEIVVKPLGKQLKGLTCYAGATIMGDGKVALILDVPGVAQLSGVLGENRGHTSTDSSKTPRAHDEKQSLLLFRAGQIDRLAVPLSLVARLEELPSARIEYATGKRVVQYRGQILPLISLTEHFGGREMDPRNGNEETPEVTQVIVFTDQDRRIGLEVDQILDIIEEHVTIRKAGSAADRYPALLGSAVVGQKVTDFLDLHAVIRLADETWFEQPDPRQRSVNILLADPNAFSRGLFRNELEMAGHRVFEAANETEVAERLAAEVIDVVVSAPVIHAKVSARLRSDPAIETIPVLSGGPDRADRNSADRETMLASIRRLAVMTASPNAEIPKEVVQ
ncbi:MAG: chemotaxis protein CheW [Bryobacteraceae bacterium]